MDGAIILAADASRIARANVHLVPNPNVPTSETGTRHRTAERVARSIDVPVISVSEDMAVDRRLPRRPASTRSSRSPACSTGPTRRCRPSSATRTASTRSSASLSALEVEDLVTRARRRHRAAAHRDGAAHRRGDRRLHRRARHRRPPRAPAARGAAWAASRTTAGSSSRTTSTRTPAGTSTRPWRRWPTSTTEDLLDLKAVGAVLHLPDDAADLDAGLQPRGYRLLAKIPRLPEPSSSASSSRFGNLQKIMRATIADGRPSDLRRRNERSRTIATRPATRPSMSMAWTSSTDMQETRRRRRSCCCTATRIRLTCIATSSSRWQKPPMSLRRICPVSASPPRHPPMPTTTRSRTLPTRSTRSSLRWTSRGSSSSSPISARQWATTSQRAGPDRIRGLIVQNGNAHDEGLGQIGTPRRRSLPIPPRRTGPSCPSG